MNKLKNLDPRIFLSIWVYLGWFGCVYSSKLGLSFAVFAFPAVSWALMNRCFPISRQLLIRLLTVTAIGLVFDSASVHFGFIEIKPSAQWGYLPMWLVAMWLLFVTSLPLLQGVFQKKLILAAVLGAVFGPFSYYSGKHFDVLFLNGTVAIAIYPLFWAILIPGAIYWLGRKD